ncbi:hypothetical protein D3C76_1292300 [compost metagenome]
MVLVLSQRTHPNAPGAITIQHTVQRDCVDLQAKTFTNAARDGFFRPGARVDVLHIDAVEIILARGCKRSGEFFRQFMVGDGAADRLHPFPDCTDQPLGQSEMAHAGAEYGLQHFPNRRGRCVF